MKKYELEWQEVRKAWNEVYHEFLDYIGLKNDNLSELSAKLFMIVSKKTSEIYFHFDQLQQMLQECNVAELEIYQIGVMTKVSGFKELIKSNEKTEQVELNLFIKNAITETGFNCSTVLRLTCDIALSLGIPFCNLHNTFNKNSTPVSAFTIPSGIYELELASFEAEFKKVLFNDSSIHLDFSILEPLVSAGIPKAKYYMGYCLLNNIQLAEDSHKGLQLLSEAAEAGDIDAAAALGDYYYNRNTANDWSAAYEYYTGYGALALTEKRKEAIVCIFNKKKYNKNIVSFSIVLLILLCFSVVFAPAKNLYSPCYFLGVISILLNIGILFVMMMHYRNKPYDDFYAFPVGMLITWFIYMLIRIL